MLLLKDPSLLKQACYIDGHWLDEAGKNGMLAVNNPATGEIIANVPQCGLNETLIAIDAARVAFTAWSRRPAAERSRILRRWYELMLENQDDLACIMTSEQGKPLAEARGEIVYAASYLEWFAEEGKRAYGDVIPSPLPDRNLIVVKEPVGVCAAITPWNFPAAMIARKAGAALAAGCTMVVKPSELTPLSAFALALLAERAGVPAGVFNVVTGNAQVIGSAMTASPVVKKLSFTGSTNVGRLLMQQCAGTIKKLSLELGGNAPFIVFDDANVDAAVAGAIASKYRNAGQTCVCTNRFLVQEAVYDEFSSKLNDAVTKLRIGNGMEGGTTQGPLIDERAVEKIDSLIDDAVSKGARVLLGGRRHQSEGTWYKPTIVVDVTQDMRLAQEEIFGPVASLIRFRAEREAIEMANQTEYGLAAYFYSRSHARVWRVSRQLEYGMVGINTGLISTEVAPFGGIKNSGLGREGSKYGLDEYVEVKYMAMAGLEEE